MRRHQWLSFVPHLGLCVAGPRHELVGIAGSPGYSPQRLRKQRFQLASTLAKYNASRKNASKQVKFESAPAGGYQQRSILAPLGKEEEEKKRWSPVFVVIVVLMMVIVETRLVGGRNIINKNCFLFPSPSSPIRAPHGQFPFLVAKKKSSLSSFPSSLAEAWTW